MLFRSWTERRKGERVKKEEEVEEGSVPEEDQVSRYPDAPVTDGHRA